MKALKVMFEDGSVIAYRLKSRDIAAVQMIEMNEDDFLFYNRPAKPDVQTMFENEGHLTVHFHR